MKRAKRRTVFRAHLLHTRETEIVQFYDHDDGRGGHCGTVVARFMTDTLEGIQRAADYVAFANAHAKEWPYAYERRRRRPARKA